MKVKGDFTKQYSFLRDSILELQRINEDTIVKIDVERDYSSSVTRRQIKRIYVCIIALDKRFKVGLKDLLGLDCCFMKGQYPSELLTVVGIDANYWTYPLAYGIVETGRHKFMGIIHAIAKIFPCADHRLCVRHLHENMKLQWKGKQFKDLVCKCTSTTIVAYFDRAMEQLKRLDENAYEYLKKTPQQHWAIAYFSGRAQCDVLLSNLCEETATYGKIGYDEDVHDLISVETEFPAIVFNDALTSEVTHSCETHENDNEKVDMPLFPSTEPKVSIRRILGNGYGVSTSCTVLGPRERNIDEYWWRIYKSGDLEVLES
ncbi:hypothetical protein Tco_1211977 [Tanacetum coccineum]